MVRINVKGFLVTGSKHEEIHQHVYSSPNVTLSYYTPKRRGQLLIQGKPPKYGGMTAATVTGGTRMGFREG